MPRYPIILHIKNPCQENWQEMAPREQGRFCAACQHTVTDFSAMTDEEIIAFLRQSSGKACGRFRASQLGRPLRAVQAPARRSLLGGWLSGLMLWSGLQAGAADMPAPAQPASTLSPRSATLPDLSPIPAPRADSLRYFIRGRVQDAYKKSLDNVSVRILDHQLEAHTDLMGVFVLPIPDSLAGQHIFLRLHCVGYQDITMPILLLTEVLPMDHQIFQLEEDRYELTGEVVVTGYPAKWYHFRRQARRLWYKTQNLVYRMLD